MIVTVIIPTYNRAAFLPRAVASIIRQKSDARFDILIVDDGSTDETPAICSDLAQAHPNLRVVRQPNMGVASARNTGLRNLLHATEIVTFLDSDDVLTLDRFAKDLPHFKDPALDLTYAQIMHVDLLDEITMEPVEGAAEHPLRSVHLSSGLYRRALIDRTGLFAEDMEQAEDTDYLHRIFEERARWIQTDTVAIYYFQHPGNMTNDLKTKQTYSAKALLRSIKRCRDDPNRSTTRPLMVPPDKVAHSKFFRR